MEHEINFEPFVNAERLPSTAPWAVYQAADSKANRPVRLSVLWASDHVAVERRQAALDWFAEAGYQAQRVSSPALPAVHAYRSTADAAYVATDLPGGRPLRVVLQQSGGLPVERAMHVSALVAGALAEAHAVGWAHGWLNADSVWLDEGDVVSVTDLGLALAAQPMAPAMGFPYPALGAFFSPDPLRRDMQCLGLLLTEMLTGNLPDPVGVPRAEIFPAEVPPIAVRAVRALVNPQSEDALSAAQWAEFARTGEHGGFQDTGDAAREPDAAYYETPKPARPSIETGKAALWGVVALGLVALGLTLSHFFMPRPNVPSPTANAPAAPNAPANAYPSKDVLTRVQVGPIAPDQEAAATARLKKMGLPVYAKQEADGVYIQVGAFASPDSAAATKDRLTQAGFPVRVK